jgi:hypothetical protein
VSGWNAATKGSEWRQLNSNSRAHEHRGVDSPGLELPIISHDVGWMTRPLPNTPFRGQATKGAHLLATREESNGEQEVGPKGLGHRGVGGRRSFAFDDWA